MEVAAQSLMQRHAHWERFRLIEFHCSFSSVSTIAQVALTAATRQHLGLRIFCCVNACIHCAGAGLAVNITQGIFMHGIAHLFFLEKSSLMQWCHSFGFCLLSQTFCFAAFSIYCKYQTLSPPCSWLNCRVTCAILQLLDSGPKR